MLATRALLSLDLDGWRMTGPGGFRMLKDGTVETQGGTGLLWYAAEEFADFRLIAEWRTTQPDDNSGIFLRIPPLKDDPQPAIEQGYEVQIDERGLDPATGREGDPLHLTGAIYELAPVIQRASRPLGEWNLFNIAVQGRSIKVTLNGLTVSEYDNATKRRSGHIGLQNHHNGSMVQFRNLEITPL